MKDTLPIIERLKCMLQPKPDDYGSDPLLKLFYDQICESVEVDNCFEEFSWSQIENGTTIRDCISDAYVYIKNDRPLQINKIIECELLENFEELAQCKEKLEEQDNYHLKLIVENRNFIFKNYDNN
jgi:hypothetical protein